MSKLSLFGLLSGLILLTILVLYQGFTSIIDLLIASGWPLLLLPVIWFPALMLAAESWRCVFTPGHTPPFGRALAGVWMGKAVNNLLPVATIGGEIVKARLMMLWGEDAKSAAASVMVDKTVQVLAVIIWGLTGVCILFSRETDNDLALSILLGFAVLSLGVAGFFLVQKAGIFSMLVKLGSKLISHEAWDGIKVNATEVDITVGKIYRRKQHFMLAIIIKSLGLAVQTAEVWLACYLLGHPLGIVEAMMLKSLTSTISDVAFLIPNGYGIQEGAFIVIGALLGISPDVALTLSIALRIRELLIDFPGLLYWQQLEGRHWFSKATIKSESV